MVVRKRLFAKHRLVRILSWTYCCLERSQKAKTFYSQNTITLGSAGILTGAIARFEELSRPSTANTFEFQLYTLPPACHANGVMWKKTLILLPALLLLAGCATLITNISAQRQLRNANGLYPVEVTYDSRQQALRWDTIQVSIIVGKETYPMRLTKLMHNRWEGLIPVPAGVKTVSYHYKFDYQVTDFGKLSKGSASSHSYNLMILDQ